MKQRLPYIVIVLLVIGIVLFTANRSSSFLRADITESFSGDPREAGIPLTEGSAWGAATEPVPFLPQQTPSPSNITINPLSRPSAVNPVIPAAQRNIPVNFQPPVTPPLSPLKTFSQFLNRFAPALKEAEWVFIVPLHIKPKVDPGAKNIAKATKPQNFKILFLEDTRAKEKKADDSLRMARAKSASGKVFTVPIEGSFIIMTNNKCPSDINAQIIDRYKNALMANKDVARELGSISCITYVTQNAWIYNMLAVMPNDPRFNELWGLHNTGQTINSFKGAEGIDINAPETWDINKGSVNVVVGVVDTGVDFNHPDLKDRAWVNPHEIPNNNIDDDCNGYIDDVKGWNFIDDNDQSIDDINPFKHCTNIPPITRADGINNVDDGYGHGTHVAGIIGATGNNAIGVTGVNWQVQIAALKIFASSGRTTSKAMLRALAYAISNNITITNHSYGGLDPIQYTDENGVIHFMAQIIESAPEVLVVASAGNSMNNNDTNGPYPASYKYPNVISVAAVDNQGSLAVFSSYGNDSVHVGAPGVSILSTLPLQKCRLCADPSDYRFLSGTSMAAPYVTGAAALLKSYMPNASSIKIKNIILNSVQPLMSLTDKTRTGGMVDLQAALMTNDQSPPIARAGRDINTNTGTRVFLNGEKSNDIIDGNNLSYTWNFGDGTPPATGVQTSHIFTKAGQYTITLTVKNSRNVTGADNVNVLVFVNPEMIQSGYLFRTTSSQYPYTVRAQNTPFVDNTEYENTVIPIELRLLLHVNTGNVYKNNYFKLQFADKGSAVSCANIPPARFEDVGDQMSNKKIAFYDLNDGYSIDDFPISSNSANIADPQHNNHYTSLQTYAENNSFRIVSPIYSDGKTEVDGLWNIELVLNKMARGSAYCLRAIKADGSVLQGYNVYPEISKPVDTPPGGYLDSTCTISGWVVDLNAPDKETKVHFYFDGPPPRKGLIPMIRSTDILRNDVNKSFENRGIPGVTGPHGFSIVPPQQYWDGKDHNVYVYGINSFGAENNTHLTGSPKIFNCKKP